MPGPWNSPGRETKRVPASRSSKCDCQCHTEAADTQENVLSDSVDMTRKHL